MSGDFHRLKPHHSKSTFRSLNMDFRRFGGQFTQDEHHGVSICRRPNAFDEARPPAPLAVPLQFSI